MKKILYTILFMVVSIVAFGQDFEAPLEGIYGGPEGQGEGLVGALGGNVDISAMGGAVYTIPLPLPPGIHDIAPNLAVVYNSQSGNGLLGWGWNLCGNSAITRVGHTLYHDGDLKGVDFHDDRFALDGQRLFVVNNKNYGENEAEYRTEIDGMNKVVSYRSESDTTNGPAYFKVWRADGTIAYYGRRYDSRIGLKQRNDACLWLLDSVVDRNGNYMTYHYNYYGGSSYSLNYIKYTGHDSGNPATAKSPFYKVRFYYESRADEETIFIGERAFHQKKRLSSIKVFYNSNEIEKFEFEYYGADAENGYFYERLERIYFERDGESYNPTKIIWSNNDYHNTNMTVGPFSYNNVFFGQQHSYYDYQHSMYLGGHYKVVGDFNGDGLSDLIVLLSGIDNVVYEAQVYINTGEGTGYVPQQGNMPGLSFQLAQTISLEKANSFSLNWIYVADFNKDGLDDFISVYRKTSMYWDEVCIDPYLTELVDGTVHIVKADSDLDGEKFAIGGTHGETLLIGDFLGRGNMDAIMQIPYHSLFIGYIKPKFLYIKCNENNRFVYDYYDEHQVLPGKKFTAADFNGDGITEIWCSNDVTDRLDKDGNDFPTRTNAVMMKMTGVRSCEQFNTDGVLSNFHVLFSGDFNGDGKTDLLTYVAGDNGAIGTWQVNYFKETGLYWNQFDITDEMPIDDPGDRSFSFSGRLNTDFQFIETGDFNGDGKTDLAVVANDSVYFFYGPLRREENNGIKGVFSGKQVVNRSEILGWNYSNQTLSTGNFLGEANRSMISGVKYFRIPSMTNRYGVYSVVDGMGNGVSFEFCYLMPYDCLFSWNYSEPNKGIYAIPVSKKALRSTCSFNIYANTPTVCSYYQYNTPLFHRYGRGFLGFAETTVCTKLNGVVQNKTVRVYRTNAMRNHCALVLHRETSFAVDNKMLSETLYDNDYLENSAERKVFVPIVKRQQTFSYSLDGNALLNNTITENVFHKDANSTDCYGLYNQTIKLDTVYEGVSEYDYISDARDCEYQTIKVTKYEPETTTLLQNWIINRPKATMAIAKRLNDPDVSKTLIKYDYKNNSSYLPEKITTYPGGNPANINKLATSTIYRYDEAGNVEAETLHSLTGFPADRTTMYEYRNYRFVKKQTDPAGFVAESDFNNKYGELERTSDCNNQTTVFWRRDHLGSTEWVKYPDQTYGCTAKRWVSDDEDAPESAVYYIWKKISGQSPSIVYYDAAGRELRSLTYGMNGRIIYKDIKYSEIGLVDSISLPYFKGDRSYWTKFEYDIYHRQILITKPDQTTIRTKYDGLITTITTNPKEGSSLPSQTRTVTVNILEQQIRSEENNNVENAITFDYYPDGKLKWTQVGFDESTRIQLQYDDAGNRKILIDPNYGMVVDSTNSFRELVSTTSPKGDVTEYEYDVAGRMVRRVEHNHLNGTEEETQWVYSDEPGEIGQLKNIFHAGRQTLTYYYDDYLRLSQVDERIVSQTYTTQYQYDAYSRISQTLHPSGFITQNRYDETGCLDAILDGADNLIWQSVEKTALGRDSIYLYGNGTTTTRSYYGTTGRLHILSSQFGLEKIQEFSYSYDDFGNLAGRKDCVFEMYESFLYDDWNRLTDITLFNQNTTVHSGISYDCLGRMTSKQTDGVLVFSDAQYNTRDEYGNLKPHAISGALMSDNVFHSQNQNIDYTIFDKVSLISQDDRELSYQYGYDHQRMTMSERADAYQKNKVYVDNCEFITENGSSRVLTYINSPTGICAVNVSENAEDHLYYVYKDHLGSWTTIADGQGEVVERYSFDAWGNLRNPETWRAGYTGTVLFDRGYTGHEHLYNFGLINMNGRMYDPVMSSFLSVDNYVQQPDNSQSFNRYAYCLNNPLRYSDPTGEVAIADDVAVVIGIAACVTVAVINNGISNTEHGQPFFQNAGEVAAVAFIQSVCAYGIGAAAQGISSVVGRVIFQAGCHFVLDGAVAEAHGGDFLINGTSGAVSSLISSGTVYLTRNTPVFCERIAVIASGTVSGGVTASMMGGDFWEGALNGFITSGMNHAMHLVSDVISGTTHLLKDYHKFHMNKQHDQVINMQLCKYFCLEAIGQYFGFSKTMSQYRDIGEAMILRDDWNHRTTLLEIFEASGFNVCETKELHTSQIENEMDYGNPILIETHTDGNGSHAIVLTGIRTTTDGYEFYIENPEPFGKSGWTNTKELSIARFYMFTNPQNMP